MLRVFITGLSTGLVLQLAIGPVFFFVLNISLQRTLVDGLCSVFAVTVVDYFYILLAIVGVCALPCGLIGLAFDEAAALVGLLIGVAISAIPATIFFLTFFPLVYLIIDQNLGIIDSFETSYRVTSGNRLMMFLIILVGVHSMYKCHLLDYHQVNHLAKM